MSPTPRPYVRRATTSLLVAVALVSATILVLGDRFDEAPGYTLTHPIGEDRPWGSPPSVRIAACMADESMRLISSDHERCRADELTVPLAVPRPGAAPDEARCPAQEP